MCGIMKNAWQHGKWHNIYEMQGHQVGTVPGSSHRAWFGRKPTSSVGSLLCERERELIGEELDIFC